MAKIMPTDDGRSGARGVKIAQKWLTTNSFRLFGRALTFVPAKRASCCDLESADGSCKIEVKSIRDGARGFGAASESELLESLTHRRYLYAIVFLDSGACYLLSTAEFLDLYSGLNLNIKFQVTASELRERLPRRGGPERLALKLGATIEKMQELKAHLMRSRVGGRRLERSPARRTVRGFLKT